MSCVKHYPVIFHEPGRSPSLRDAWLPGHCSPVSVLDGQVLLHSFHQVPEALGQDLLLGERLAAYQTGPQFTEILLGDRRSIRALTLNLGLKNALGEVLDQVPSAQGSYLSQELWSGSTVNCKPLEKTEAVEAFLGRNWINLSNKRLAGIVYRH